MFSLICQDRYNALSVIPGYNSSSKMVSKGKKRPFISSSSDVGRHFFKVYLPAESSQRLEIPATFLEDLNRALPKIVILKDSSKRPSCVEMKKVGNVFYFQKGWQSFMKKHSLVFGEFMVFRYDGKSGFHVKIYDHHGCEKEETSSDSLEDVDNTSDGESCPKLFKTHKGVVSKASASDKLNPYFLASINPKNPYHLHIPKKILSDGTILLKPKMFLFDPSKKHWPVSVSSRKDGRHSIGSGWMDFCRGNNLTEKDVCKFEFRLIMGSENDVIDVHIERGSHSDTCN